MGEITGMKAAFQGNTDTLVNLLLNNLNEAEKSDGKTFGLLITIKPLEIFNHIPSGVVFLTNVCSAI